jgi:hypothetical protein
MVERVRLERYRPRLNGRPSGALAAPVIGPSTPDRTFRSIGVGDTLYADLRREAVKRETTVDRLARDLLDRIVADKLIRAVLDD